MSKIVRHRCGYPWGQGIVEVATAGVKGGLAIRLVVNRLASESMLFEVCPMPGDYYEVTVLPAYRRLLENAVKKAEDGVSLPGEGGS